ncbi:MAG TPA: S8 family serine peptidase [Geomonas sp.]|nr:S8 family serine peptidase [Geomonas sp.]
MTRKTWLRNLWLIPAAQLLWAGPVCAQMHGDKGNAAEHSEDGVMLPGPARDPLAKLPRHLPGRLVVKLKEGKNTEHIRDSIDRHGLKVSQKKLANTSHQRFKDLYDLRAGKDEDLSALADELKANPAVEYAEPVPLFYTQLIPNDPLYPQQWSHQKTQASSGWDITTGSPSVVVAVIDTGVAYSHPDLSANIWRDSQGNPGKDFVDIVPSDYIAAGYQLISGEDYQTVDFDPSDYNGHGTHVAGIIAAAGNNGVGVSGVCPQCRVMPLRAGFSVRQNGSDYGVLDGNAIANAIIYAADNGAKVINMSFGGPASQLESDALNYADSKGVVLVAAAGNSNTSATDNSYPAAYSNVVSVAATDQNDVRAWYSNYGSWVSVAAPGGDGSSSYPIVSTVPYTGSLGNSSGYAGLSGTSMASPYVAGLAGLILSKNPALTGRQVAEVLKQGVDAVTVSNQQYIGSGRVNVSKALQINTVSSATVSITSPAADFMTGQPLAITGSASAPYQVFYGAGSYPSSWTQIGSGPATSGVLATLDPAILPAPYGDYTVKVTAQDANGSVSSQVHGNIGKQFLPGWPQKFTSYGSAYLWNSPNLADIDNDGLDEIVVTGRDSSGRGTISVYKQDGTLLSGWPQTMAYNGTSLELGAAVGDLDQDGNREIVAAVQDPYNSLHPTLMCWDRFGNLRWSKNLEAGNPTLNPTLADLYGDGKLEIITETYNSSLYVLDGLGNVKWSYPLGEYDSWYNEKTVAVADLDGDGKKEIVKNVIRNIRYAAGDTYRTTGGSLMVFNSDGTVRWRHDWPEAGEPLTAKYYEFYPVGSPVVGDINNDGLPEVMVQLAAWKGNDSGTTEVTTRFFAFDSNGNVLPGWPVVTPGYFSWAEMALGDLKQDGFRELVAANRNLLYAIKYDGSQLFAPLSLQVQGNLSIADVTGDGTPDIVAFDGTNFNVVRPDGTYSTLPITSRNSGSNMHNTPVLADLNKSGTLKLVFPEAGSRALLWAWDLQVPFDQPAQQWGMFGFDSLHSGLLASPSLSPVSIATGTLPSAALGTPYSLTLSATGGTAPYRWALTRGGLPAGLTLNAATGVISGTPITGGSSSFTLRTVDAQSASASKSFSLASTGGLAPVLLFGRGLYYSLLQDAYNNSQDGDIIELQGITFSETPYFRRNITVTLQGGFDGSFASATGSTLLSGALSVRDGKVKMNGVVLR